MGSWPLIVQAAEPQDRWSMGWAPEIASVVELMISPSFLPSQSSQSYPQGARPLQGMGQTYVTNTNPVPLCRPATYKFGHQPRPVAAGGLASEHQWGGSLVQRGTRLQTSENQCGLCSNHMWLSGLRRVGRLMHILDADGDI